MDEKEFYDLVRSEYESAFDLSNALYPRAGIFLTAQVVLGSAVVTLGRPDLLRRVFERVDIFLYYCSASTAYVSVSLAVACLVFAIFPRDYPKLIDLAAWSEWRQKLTTQSTEASGKDSNDADAKFRTGVLDRLIDATDKANRLNQQRLLLLKRSIQFTAIAACALALEAVMAFILKVQGL